MISSLRTPAARLALAALSLSISSALYAQNAPAPTASDWGGIGLLQTPTARMADEGELARAIGGYVRRTREIVTL